MPADHNIFERTVPHASCLWSKRQKCTWWRSTKECVSTTFARSEVRCLLSGAAASPALLSCVNLELLMEAIIGTEAPSLAAKCIRAFFFYKHICRWGDRIHSDIADQSRDDTPTENGVWYSKKSVHGLRSVERQPFIEICLKVVVQGMEIRDTRIVSQKNSA